MPYKDPEVRRIKAREYARAWRERNPQWQVQHNEDRRQRYAVDEEYRDAIARPIPKHVHAAHMRVYKAIKRGEITRPSNCSQCGRESFVEAAHENYTERLAIRWLCRSCHRQWDALNPKSEEIPARKPMPDWRTQLSEEQLSTIRSEHALGASQVALSKKFAISRNRIAKIVGARP